jgi:ferredoxin-NADP reductase/predicted pyridoxine 5'-phosphate oxidase superfamily flavin-nucleotide-binding protein
MMDTVTRSPFHHGEREIQSRFGVRDQLEDIGQRYIHNSMPGEHRQFYAQLPFLLVGSVDRSGRPWASVLVGRPGFAHSPEPQTLEIDTPMIFGDPLADNLAPGAQLGILGIEYQSRRRNRMNGEITSVSEAGMAIRIKQAFGNCPKYIQARSFEFLPEIDSIGESQPRHSLSSLNGRAGEIIASADNFYIATHYSQDPGKVSHGADVSHRGGKPGFVRLDDDRTLTFPDFVGNYHFNTLGNIAANPLTGLLFIDFDSGDLLYLTGRAKIIWDSEDRRAFVGAERLVRFTLDEGFLIENAMPIRWDFHGYSPSLENTGSWEEVAEKTAARSAGNVYQDYNVIRVVPESEIISSFYLEPKGGEQIHCHKAGQFLPIEIQPPGEELPIQRTYTISSAPNGSFYRLSVKKEPHGLSSNFFHDHVKPGSTIRAMTPRGQFTLDETSNRPVVLLSAGVGITPLLSMLEQLASETSGCGCERPVWFVHGASNSRVQAFGKQLRSLEADWPCLNVHIRHSNPMGDDIEGEDYDSSGHIDIEFLKSLLPFDDYEFYLCGPTSFMESVYEGLNSLSVSDQRIHYEFFGAGTSLGQSRPGGVNSLAVDLGQREPVAVKFARSGIDATWNPASGTLLDLAESEGLRPAYSCRSGICQTCSTPLVSGEVDYTEPPMTPPADGEALICCAYPRPGRDADGAGESIVLDL